MPDEIGIARFPIFPEQRGDGDAEDKRTVIFLLARYLAVNATRIFPETRENSFPGTALFRVVSPSREYYHKRLI